MKRILFITIIAVSGLMFSPYAYAQPTWRLYDDFSSNSIDTSKWNVDDSSATITIENGRAKFVHEAGHSQDSSWLFFANTVKEISGIKATITVESCSADSDIQARILGIIGTVGTDIAFAQHAIRPYQHRISAGITVAGPLPSGEFKYDYFWGNFKNPMEVIGVPFTISTVFSSSGASNIVDGLGELDYTLPIVLGNLPEDQNFIYIGTRSNSGVGTCTVYFDDVYILVDDQISSGQGVSIIPAISLLLEQEGKL